MDSVRLSSAEGRANTDDRANVSRGLKIQALGKAVLRYGLVVVLAWIGAMKFTGYEAKGIEPFIAHSPFLGWMYRLLTLQQVSNGLGIVEIGMAVSIALGPLVRKNRGFRKRGRCAYVFNHPELLVFDSRVGAQSRRLSCPLRRHRRISIEGYTLARSVDLVVWRSLGKPVPHLGGVGCLIRWDGSTSS